MAIAVREGADVGVEQEALAVLEQTVRVSSELALPSRMDLHFGAAQGDSPHSKLVGEEVVEAGGAVEGGVAIAGGDGVAVLLL